MAARSRRGERELGSVAGVEGHPGGGAPHRRGGGRARTPGVGAWTGSPEVAPAAWSEGEPLSPSPDRRLGLGTSQPFRAAWRQRVWGAGGPRGGSGSRGGRGAEEGQAVRPVMMPGCVEDGEAGKLRRRRP